MPAYIGGHIFRFRNDEVFRTALLFYSDLYLPVDIASLRWNDGDRASLERAGTSWPSNTPVISLDLDPNFLAHFGLKLYLGFNPAVLEALKPRLHDVRLASGEAARFFADVFPVENSAISISFMDCAFRAFCSYHGIKIKNADELKTSRFYDCLTLIYEIFVTDFLQRKCLTDPVLTFEHYSLREAMMNLPDGPLWTTPEEQGMQAHFPYNTIHELLGRKDIRGATGLSAVSKILVPSLDRIPIEELVKFIVTDKVRPIAEFVRSLRAKYSRQISEQDLIAETVSQLFAAVRVLYPTAPSIAVGVLGNVPTPWLINPVGLLSTAQSVSTRRTVQKDYAWLLAVCDLREAAAEAKSP